MMKGFLLLFLPIFLLAPALAQQSRNGEFSALVQTRSGAKNACEHNTWAATVVDKNGRQRFQLSKEIAYDVQFPFLSVADNGACIVINSFEGVVEFYSPSGNLDKTLLPFGKRTAEYEQNIKCSTAGSKAALFFSSSESERASLLITDLDGNELWCAALNGKQAGEVFLSSNAKFVAAGSYTPGENILRTTEVFDAAGRAIRSFAFLFRQADIGDDGRVLLAEREKALFASLFNNQNAVQWNAVGANQVITTARIIGTGSAIVLETGNLPNGKLVYQNPSLVVFNANGKEIARIKLNSSSQRPAQLTIGARELKLSTPSAQGTLSLATLK
jgi:hypothetical protein